MTELDRQLETESEAVLAAGGGVQVYGVSVDPVGDTVTAGGRNADGTRAGLRLDYRGEWPEERPYRLILESGARLGEQLDRLHKRRERRTVLHGELEREEDR